MFIYLRDELIVILKKCEAMSAVVKTHSFPQEVARKKYAGKLENSSYKKSLFNGITEDEFHFTVKFDLLCFAA